MSDITNAEYLLETAALMRERAKAASVWEGRWEIASSRARVIEIKGDGWDDAIIAKCVDYSDTENGTEQAQHIASWRPGVALIAAEMLERFASTWSLDPDLQNRVGGDEILAFAKAYRGES